MKILKVKDFHGRIIERIIDEDNPSNKVEIYPLHRSRTVTSYEKTEYGINWSANGTVSVEEAEEYIKLMQEAVKEARKQSK